MRIPNGTKLLFVQPQWSRKGRIERVERETKTQAICGTRRYRKRDGRRVGPAGTGEYARPATQDDLDEIERRRLADKLTTHDWRKESVDTLRLVMAKVEWMGTDDDR